MKLHPVLDWFVSLLVAISCVCVFLVGLQDASHEPHHVKIVVGNRVVVDEWTTNNLHVEWVDGGIPGTPFGSAHLVTNEYWHIYEFFPDFFNHYHASK